MRPPRCCCCWPSLLVVEGEQAAMPRCLLTKPQRSTSSLRAPMDVAVLRAPGWAVEAMEAAADQCVAVTAVVEAVQWRRQRLEATT